MGIREDATEMYKTAREHGDQYLLPKRFAPGQDPKNDALYDAADWLVSQGFAEWISPASNKRPGINLTRDPIEYEQGSHS